MIRIVIGLAVGYLAYCCLLFLLQRRIVFPRELVGTPPRPEVNLPGLEEMWLETSFGKVEAWYVPPRSSQDKEPSPAVIFAHGNAELIDYWPQELNRFASLGIGLLLVEYPGYGRSGGAPSEKAIRETFLIAYDTLISRPDVDPSRILLFGRSLGGGAVCGLAAERPSAGLILMSTFTSVKSFAKRYLVPDFLIRDPFDNLSVVGSYDGPVLLFHGKRDSLIPYKHGVALEGAAKRGQMITYDCAHNDCPPSWDIFWRDLTPLLQAAGIIGN